MVRTGSTRLVLILLSIFVGFSVVGETTAQTIPSTSLGWDSIPNTRLLDASPPDGFIGYPSEFRSQVHDVILAWSGGAVDTLEHRKHNKHIGPYRHWRPVHPSPPKRHHHDKVVQGKTRVKVGNFTKSTTVGQQSIPHGLGVIPKALILWTAGGDADGVFRDGFRFAFGVTDGTTSRSAAAASENARDFASASRGQANKVLTLIEGGEIVRAEADLLSWDEAAFTLNWTSNDPSTPYLIHFIAIGGADVLAKVVQWQVPTEVGDKSVTGVGFRPDLVIHAHSGGLTDTPPAISEHGTFGLGVMDKNGGLWASEFHGVNGRSTNDTQRGQQTDSAIYAFRNTLEVGYKGSYVSIDPDGFTLNFSTIPFPTPFQVFSLALKGVQSKVGSLSKPSGAGAIQEVMGVGFRPKAVLLSSVQDVAQAAPVAHSRFGLGASDGTTQGASAIQDLDVTTPTRVQGLDTTRRAFVKVDNPNSAVDAEANVTLRPDGFTITWPVNDSVATEILYLAIGAQ